MQLFYVEYEASNIAGEVDTNINQMQKIEDTFWSNVILYGGVW